MRRGKMDRYSITSSVPYVMPGWRACMLYNAPTAIFELGAADF
jgi:hypothetical protein